MHRQLSIGRARSRPLPLALLLLGVIALGALVSMRAVLILAPVLALMALLLAGRTPGEELMLRWRRRLHRPRDRRAVSVPVRRQVVLFVRWADRMSASALAMRPPPLAALGIR